MQRILSAATVAAIGLTCKAYLHSGLCSISVRGLPYLLEALDSPERQNGQGVVTVSNHLSTNSPLFLRLDDPLVWGILPARTYLRSHLTRWTLGASDIIFTNPVFSAFFRQGQVIETFRGAGIYQPAVDVAIEKLRAGAWIHVFGEGKVCQSNTYKADPMTGIARLERFKWGIGRMLMETPRPPTIIPMWITGFDKLMPEGRHAPWKYLPRAGARLSVTFGAPLPHASVHAALRLGPEVDATSVRAAGLQAHCHGRHGHRGEEEVQQQRRHWQGCEAEVRIALTELVQRAVEALGRQVSGDLLTGLPRT
ncbi:acyltransferase-domain-containing protein [Lactifluus subvellereus]|nr:acyltransferase-domain-containing protein [Lactifluus subvellereus]